MFALNTLKMQYIYEKFGTLKQYVVCVNTVNTENKKKKREIDSHFIVHIPVRTVHTDSNLANIDNSYYNNLVIWRKESMQNIYEIHYEIEPFEEDGEVCNMERERVSADSFDRVYRYASERLASENGYLKRLYCIRIVTGIKVI